MILDFHTHNFPDALAPRALKSMLEKLEGRLPPVGDGTLDCQLRDMDRFGVDEAVVGSLATKPKQFSHIFERACAVRDGQFGAAAAKRLHQLCSVHPDDPDFEAHLKAIAAAGFKGVAFHPYYMNFSLAEARVVPVFEAVRDNGLFATCHCGADLGYVEAPMSCGPYEVATLLRRVPGLVFVAAHLGGVSANPPHATDALLPFENCYIDTAVLNVDEDNPEAQRVMRTFPAARLLFGTDYFWRDEARLIAWVRRHRESAADQEKIFSANARYLLSGEAAGRSIDRTA